MQPLLGPADDHVLAGSPEASPQVPVTKMAAKQPPPLMKKHSQTDLVSRLKTRKILGVGGEDDDGEVHRSKISQVLGNEIKFAVREPLGLRVWQFVSAVLFSGVAIMALAFPDQLFDAVFDGAEVNSKTPIRLYGGALLSISLIMWNALYTAEKVIIRWTLLTEACYFGVQFLAQATLATGCALVTKEQVSQSAQDTRRWHSQHPPSSQSCFLWGWMGIGGTVSLWLAYSFSFG
uniref:Tumor protein p53-inducible protein 11 n=1 Tax=Phascolarctos cinereus TaxID=38626 RepID=A0A6P5M479_PHACI|nr:tumor protein p53-inducible protein 11 isoform X2 [Phascolarctos cinereus]